MVQDELQGKEAENLGSGVREMLETELKKTVELLVTTDDKDAVSRVEDKGRRDYAPSFLEVRYADPSPETSEV